MTENIKDVEMWDVADLEKEVEALMAHGKARGLSVTRFYFLLRHSEASLRDVLGISHVETRIIEKVAES